MKIHNVCTISQNISFLDSLARIILSKYNNKLELSSALILLPNYRSAGILQDIFRKNSGFLPRIKPIGSMDEEFLVFSGFDIRPKISVIQRKMMLIDLMIRDLELEPNMAMYLLFRVENVLDELQRQQNVKLKDGCDDLLRKIVRAYYALLGELGYSDIIEHYNSVINGYATLWTRNPPDFPVIAVGSTASLSATRNILKTIVGLPNGIVVLPNLASNMSNREWNNIDETHHQYNLKFFLEYIGVDRKDVTLLE